jgi:hypothetical protein
MISSYLKLEADRLHFVAVDVYREYFLTVDGEAEVGGKSFDYPVNEMTVG